MTLLEAQRLFHAAVTSPGSVGPARLQAAFRGTAALPADRRLAVYGGMYLGRLQEALAATFPALARLVGDELAGLARDYLRAHPSAHHDIGQAGRRLPRFLRAHPDPARPDLGDLAALEWARQEAFFAAPAEAVGAEALAGLAPAEFVRARLRLAPSLRLLALDHDVTGPRRALTAGTEPGPVRPAPTPVAVWRSGFEVFHAALPAAEAVALRAALDGRPLGEVCAAFDGAEDPAGAALGALASWLAEGWVARVVLPSAAAPGARARRERT